MSLYFIEIRTTGLSAKEDQVVEIVFLEKNATQSHIFRFGLGKTLSVSKLLEAGLDLKELESFPERSLGLDLLREFLVNHCTSNNITFSTYVGEFFSSFWRELLEEVYPFKDDRYEALKNIPIVSLMEEVKSYHHSSGEKIPNYKKITVFPHILGKTYEGIEDLKELALFLEEHNTPPKRNSMLLEGLNASQREAVLSVKGPLLLLAGAGAGKTRVIIHKILHALQIEQIPAEKILAVTFTNKAAKEMKDRLKQVIGPKEANSVHISTFHSLGLQILKKEYKALGYQEEFSIFGDSDKEALLREVLLELKLSEELYPLSFVKFLMSQKKSHPLSYKSKEGENEKNIFNLYEQKLAKSQAFDFDDLIYKPLILMEKEKEIGKEWGESFQIILVDEYQDTNEAQFYMLQYLSKGFGNICVVGDDDQSIYAFRGGDVKHILSFGEHFPNAKRILLDHNYRNPPYILEAAMNLISHNRERYEKNIVSGKEPGENDKIYFYEAEDADEEGQWVANEVFANRIDRSVPYEEQAILCRTNTQMRSLEKALREQNIPYRLIGGFSFFDRAEVKNIFAYLRLFYNPKDNQAFYRAVQFPKRGVGEKTLLNLSDFALKKDIELLKACVFAEDIEGISSKASHQLLEFSDLYWDFRNLLEHSGRPLSEILEDFYVRATLQEEIVRVYENDADSRLRSLQDILMDIKKKEKRSKWASLDTYSMLGQYLQETILAQIKDEEENEGDKVSLMTIHAAKGLEFRTIFIPGFQEGIFPHEKSLSLGENGLLEERRLCYVAFTRAKDFLFLSMYKTGSKIQKDKEFSESRFLEEIPQKLLERVSEETSRLDEMEYLQKMREILQIKE